MSFSSIGELSALLTAFLWSMTAISFELAAKKIGSELVNIGRLLIALILLTITVFAAGLSTDISNFQALFLVLSGLVGLVFGDGFLFKALQLVGARISMVVMSLAPALSLILALIFLNEIITPIGILGICITLGGILFVVSENSTGIRRKSSINLMGYIFAFLGALGQAIGLILAKVAFNEGEINGFVATYYRIIPAIVLLLPLYFLKQNSPPIFETIRRNPKAMKYLAFGSFVGPYLGITFSLIAVTYTHVGIAATIMATVPIIMLPISRYYMKEKLTIRTIMGAFATVVGVSLLFIK